jgi:hypothetical protein
MQALRDEDDQQEENRQTMNPKVAKKKQGGASKKLNKEDIFKRQLKAAKSISTGCCWVLNECARGRIMVTDSYSFGTTHFSEICITKAEYKWLEDHNSIEKVLNEVILAYAHASEWEPFPKICLSLEDRQRMEEAAKKNASDVAEAKKLCQTLLVRSSDHVGKDQHQIAYGANNVSTEWIKERLQAKRPPTNKSKKSAAAAAASSTAAAAPPPAADPAAVSIIKKCAVPECVEPTIEGYCTNSGCSHFRFCSLHLDHTSHMWQPLEQPVSTATVVMVTILLRYFPDIIHFNNQFIIVNRT